MTRRILTGLTLLILMAALIAGCGAGRAKLESVAQDGAVGVQAPGAYPAEKMAAESRDAYAPTSPVPPAQPSSMPAPIPSPTGAYVPPGTTRKIIQNAMVDMKVKDADEVIGRISTAVVAGGGYVQETRQEGRKETGRHVAMTLRVPAGEFGSVLELAASLGEINNRRVWTNDVTEEYLDLEARIQTKEIHLAQLRKLYAMTGSIREMMELEQEIARVTSDLESMKGRINYLRNQVDLSTITIGMYEPGVPTPIRDPQSVWERVAFGFKRSWNNVVNFTGDLMVFVASAIPVLAYMLVAGVVAFLVLRPLLRLIRRQPPSA